MRLKRSDAGEARNARYLFTLVRPGTVSATGAFVPSARPSCRTGSNVRIAELLSRFVRLLARLVNGRDVLVGDRRSLKTSAGSVV